MTKEERAEKARQARAAAARKRSEELEKQQLAEIASVWERIPKHTRDALKYIENEIPKRSPEDVAFLRETRRIHLTPFRAAIETFKKEAADADA